MQMTPSQARVIDPILTAVAQGYKNNEFIGIKIFPTVPVTQRGGKILSFSKEDFMLYGTARAPGNNTKRVQFGYAGAPYALEDFRLEGVLPIENMQEASAVPGIDLGAMTVRKTQNIIGLRLEKAQADLARNPANYDASNKLTLSGTSQWSDFSGTSDPIKDVETAKEVVRKQTGKRPNIILMGAQVFASLKQHPKIVDRMKYTGRDIATPEILASLFSVKEVVVGDSVYADDAGNLIDVWGKDVVLAYTVTGSATEMGEPTFGYTYQLQGYVMVEQPYEDRNANSWVYPVADSVAPVIAGKSAGYLITNAVS